MQQNNTPLSHNNKRRSYSNDWKRILLKSEKINFVKKTIKKSIKRNWIDRSIFHIDVKTFIELKIKTIVLSLGNK